MEKRHQASEEIAVGISEREYGFIVGAQSLVPGEEALRVTTFYECIKNPDGTVTERFVDSN
ncbi:MAG: hypothetical protein AAGG72_09935 [Pseudomonadota bacterium]